MKRLLILAMVLSVLLITAPVNANSGTLYVDDDDPTCDGNSPCYTHPQDAVNAANPGDTILVYPGTYGSRRYTSPTPPHWSAPNDQYAPALIVYKDELTIKAVDPDPANTVIETTHDYWSNPVAIQASTGGTWDGSQYVGAGVYPTAGTAPNAVAIIASNITIRGFTLRKPYMGVAWSGFWNTAGVMIGGLYAGDPDHLGSDGNTVENCVFKDVWHAVYIWHSSDNMIVNNTVEPLGASTNHWAAIEIYDGYNDDQINLGYTSKDNKIINNTVADKGIFVGAWAPSIWTDNTGTKVHGNHATGLLTGYSSGSKVFSGNTVSWYGASQASDYKFPGKSNHGKPPGWHGW
jgi:parallel beta-helix repeat protein